MIGVLRIRRLEPQSPRAPERKAKRKQQRQRLESCSPKPRNTKVASSQQKLGDRQKGFPLGTYRGNQPCKLLHLGLQNYEKIGFCCLKPPRLW